MPGFDEYLTRQFPGVRITSGRRDPNSPLGRANPRSWHNQGKAWDTTPIPGMTYDQYVDRIKQDGWNVLEARDEVRNPSAHATGPHWHVAVNGRKEQPQVNNLASLMQGVYPMAQQEAAGGQQGGLAALLGQGAIQPNVAPMQAPQANIPDPNKRPVWKDILGGVLDTIAIAGGREGGYWPAITKEQELETEGRRKLEQMLALQQQKRAEREEALQGQMQLHDYRTANPGPTNAQKEYEWARQQPGMENVSYQDWVTNYYRPQFFEQGGQRYQVTQGGLPPEYDPNEWEIVQ